METKLQRSYRIIVHVLREKTSIVPIHIVSPSVLKSYNETIGHESAYVIQFDGERIPPGTGFHTSTATRELIYPATPYIIL